MMNDSIEQKAKDAAKKAAKDAFDKIKKNIAKDNNTINILNLINKPDFPPKLKLKGDDATKLSNLITNNLDENNILNNIDLVIKQLSSIKSKASQLNPTRDKSIIDYIVTKGINGYMQNIDNKLQAFFTLQAESEKEPEQFFRAPTSSGFQIKTAQPAQPTQQQQNIFKNTSNYQIPQINLIDFNAANPNIHLPKIDKYNFDSSGKPLNKSDKNQTQNFQESVQNIVYTKLMDDNFMRSEPNTVIFWSKCDITKQDIANNSSLQNIFNMPSTLIKIRKNNNELPENINGANASAMIAYSLNRRPLVDVWKSNDFATIPGNQSANHAPFNELSRTLAERAAGTVFFVSGDKDPTTNKYGDTWENIEKPALMKNPNITMIIEINVKNPEEVKTITFPHGITQEIKSQYPIFKNLKQQIQKIDYESKTIKYIDRTEHSLDDPLNKVNLNHPIKRTKSPIKPLQLRNSQQTNIQKAKRRNSLVL